MHVLPLLALALSVSAAPAPSDEAIQMSRLSREGRQGDVFVVKVTRSTGEGETVVFAIQGPGGQRLFLRRQASGPSAIVHEVWLDTPPGLFVTRRGVASAEVEGGGWSLRVAEGDLGRRTVRCWLGTIASKVDPRLLTAAADVRVLYEASGLGSLDAAFYPVWLLWHVDEPASVAPGGRLRTETGVYTGEPWDSLVKAAREEFPPSCQF